MQPPRPAGLPAELIGVIYSGQGIGQDLRSSTAPNIDQITLAPLQLRLPGEP
jgi:hypothetical protein